MHKNKCPNCGIVNQAYDHVCRRCGTQMGSVDQFMTSSSRISPREAAKSSSWLTTLVFLAIVAGVVYYLFSGVEKSYDGVKTAEKNRPGFEANKPADTLGTRSQFQQQQKQNYRTALQNSQGLAQSANHTAEVEKLMQSTTK